MRHSREKILGELFGLASLDGVEPVQEGCL